MESLSVSLADRSYPIHIGAGVVSRVDLLLPHLARPKAVVVTKYDGCSTLCRCLNVGLVAKCR